MEKLFNKFRKKVTQSKLLVVEGNLQIEGEVIHVIASKCHDLSPLLRKLMLIGNGGAERTPGTEPDKDHSGENVKPGSAHNGVVQGNIFPDGRNFR